MKTCVRCGEQKPLEMFFYHPSTADGLTTHCKPCNAARRREWREKNRARANSQQIAYNRANKSSRSIWTAKNRESHREQRRVDAAKYRLQNPASHTASEAKRRAAKLQRLVGDESEIKSVYATARSDSILPCFYCGGQTLKKNRHVDHVIPLSRGGTHSVSNLAIACADCNLRKGTKTPAEFAAGGAS